MVLPSFFGWVWTHDRCKESTGRIPNNPARIRAAFFLLLKLTLEAPKDPHPKPYQNPEHQQPNA